MKRIFRFLLIPLLAMVTIQCSGNRNSLILCTEIMESGDESGNLLVLKPDGSVVSSLPLPDDMPGLNARAKWRAKVLYTTLSGDLLLVDAAAATVTPLGLDTAMIVNIAAPASTPAGKFQVAQLPDRVVLVNLETGAVTDLPVSPTAQGSLFGIFDPTGENLLLTDLGSLNTSWLVSTSKPGEVWQFEGFSDISNDGSHIVYRKDDTIFLGKVASRAFEPIAENASRALFLKDDLLIIKRDSVVYYELKTGESKVIYEIGTDRLVAFPAMHYYDRQGILLSVFDRKGNTSIAWVYVNVADRTAVEIDLDPTFRPLSQPGRFALFGRIQSVQGSVAPRVMDAAAVDLSNGSWQPIQLPQDGLFWPSFQTSADCRHTIVNGGDSSIWLLDMEKASASKLTAQRGNFDFSPDGSQCVVSSWEERDLAGAELSIYALGSPENGKPLGVRCTDPVWVTDGN